MGEPSDLDRFAELLVSLVRDKTIASCDDTVAGGGKDPWSRRWHEIVQSGSSIADVLEELIPDIVDETLFYLCAAIDSGELPLWWPVAATNEVRPLEDIGMCEMAGWYLGTEGWRDRFSRKRFADPLADLELGPEGDRDTP